MLYLVFIGDVTLIVFLDHTSNVCCSGLVFFFHYLFLFTKLVNSRHAEHKLTLGT